MGNCVQAFFGDRFSTGHAFSECAILNSAKRCLYHPNFQQSGIPQALQHLVAFTLRGAFLDICIGRLIELCLDPCQARVEFI
jgi:hypothetical protein